MDYALSVCSQPIFLNESFFANAVSVLCILYSLNAELEKILGDLGVELVEDLDTIFQGDEGLLLTIRAQLAAPDVDAFIRTYHQYKEPVDNNSTTEASSTCGYTFDNGSCSMISGTSSSGSKRKSPEERLKEQKEAKITRRIEGYSFRRSLLILL